jgi:hypothetical protein
MGENAAEPTTGREEVAEFGGLIFRFILLMTVTGFVLFAAAAAM